MSSIARWGLVALAISLLGFEPAAGQIVNRFGVMVPMRDGVRLAANLWIPDATGRHPTILLRTPYDKTAQFTRYRLLRYLEAGYAVVLQDTRGRGDSEGVFDFYFPEGRDGFDTIEWIATQPWSNGRVGMDGGSYLGTVQWLAAREQPPHLRCIAPTASSGRLFDEIPYLGGAFRMEWALPWLHSVAGRVSQGPLNALIRWDSLAAQRPLSRHDTLMGRPMGLYQAMLRHSTLDAWWRRIQLGPADFARITIPSLTVTGWFDGDQPGALWYWGGMASRPPGQHWLVIGPWNHGQTYLGGATRIGEISLDSSSVLDIQQLRLDFFDWCLKGTSPAFEQPRARVFVTGTNRWISADRYPTDNTSARDLFLSSQGQANGLSGNGRLTWEAPADEPPDRYRHDPRDPVPSRDPTTDHRAVEARSDVLVYTSTPLTDTLEVLGRIFVHLWAATDARDTDFTAKLLDVHPDGRAILLGSQAVGVRRARYRQGYDRERPVTPGAVLEYRIELFDVGHGFLPGHRIRLEIASSAVPYINPNQGTGAPVATDTAFVVAQQTVWHTSARPSRVVLPVITAR